VRLPDPRERPWLTVAEVAAITGEGQKVIRAAIDAGQLPSLRVGRYVRVPTAALYALCGLGTEGETPAPPLRLVEPDGGPGAA
jgi:excisionase family DNA binding protein